MSGVTMYALKPLITRETKTINNESNVSMYEMKNIHLHSVCSISRDSDNVQASKFCNNVADISQDVINILKNPLPEVALLEARQEKILSQLAELKEQVLGLCDVLKTSNEDGKTIDDTMQKREPIVAHVIVKADPRRPCWTLGALSRVWKNVNFSIKTYRHSSVYDETIPKFDAICNEKFLDTVNVELIWKRVDDTEFILSGINGSSLIGEANFLRYLARQLYNDNCAKLPDEFDICGIHNILDISYCLKYQETPKDEQSMITMMSEKLKKNVWFLNDEKPGIVDLAVWSAIKQATIKKLPSNLSLWFERAEKMFLK